jgi:hypothetical protein
VSNVLAALGSAAAGVANALQQQREWGQQQQMLAMVRAASGVSAGDVPQGASISQNAGAANAPPLPTSLMGGQSPNLGMAPPNPAATDSSLLNPNPMGGAAAASPDASPLTGPPSGADVGATPPLSRLSGSPPPAAPTDTSVLTALHNARALTAGAPTPPPIPTDQASIIRQQRAAAGPGGASLSDPIVGMPTAAAMASNRSPILGALNGAAAQTASGSASSQTPSDADVANARGTINGQITFNNPTVIDPLTGQPTPRYRAIGADMTQDVLASPAAEKIRLDQLATDRMLAMWNIRGQSTLDRANIQANAHLQGIGAQQAGAGTRSDAAITARTTTAQARIDAQEKTAAANRAQAMQRVLVAQSPTEQQRAQLTLNAYDKLTAQAKDPITGTFSADPDDLWQHAQDMVSKAMPAPGKAGAPPASAPRAAQTTAAPAAAGFGRFLGKPVAIGGQTLTIGPKTIAAASDPNDPNHAAAVRMLNGASGP